MIENLYTVKEVAEIMKTSKHVVYNLINLGLLNSIKLGSVKVRESTLNQFIDDYEGENVNALIEASSRSSGNG